MGVSRAKGKIHPSRTIPRNTGNDPFQTPRLPSRKLSNDEASFVNRKTKLNCTEILSDSAMLVNYMYAADRTKTLLSVRKKYFSTINLPDRTQDYVLGY